MRLHELLPAAALALVIPTAALAQTPPAATPAAPPVAAPAVPASPNVVAKGDIVSTLRGSGHFTILLKALDGANLSATLASTPNLTLFAPTDDAFHQLPAGQLNALLAPANAPTLQKILIYHLVHLDLDTSKIRGARGPVQSVEQGQLQLDGSGAVLKVNNADIIQADVRASNGLIQVIDKVLVPQDVTLPSVSAAASTGSPAS